MVRTTEARDASAISSLGKLLARLEPSGGGEASPSITALPPPRQLYDPFSAGP